MKVLLCLSLFVITVLEAGVLKTHSKRFTGFNVAGIGGSAGCVVVGQKLFANGLFLRDLNETEKEELSQYVEGSKKYKEDLKTSLEKKRKAMKMELQSENASNISISSEKEILPKLPKKPSFCSTAETTRYYFDGCMVQNNKIFVGQTYVKDLTSEEIEELKKFDVQMTAYQKYLSSSIQQQINSLFGEKTNLLSLFTGTHFETIPQTSEHKTGATNQTPIEAPETPSFCVAIY